MLHLAAVTTSECRKELSHARFTKVKQQMSNCHKDLSLSRIQKDHQNAQKMFEFLAEGEQFHIDTVLIHLDSAEVADESVNVFKAQTIEESLIQV